MADFGWSYPAGCSGPPEDYYPDEPIKFRCSKCGRFVSGHSLEFKPIMTVGTNFWGEEEVYEVGEIVSAICKHCGKTENPEPIYE